MRLDTRTVQEYLDSLPENRRMSIETVRTTLLERLPAGYGEAMNWGMIRCQAPLASYPGTDKGEPLMYAALASQKGHMAVYRSAVCADEAERDTFEQAYRANGRKFDAGKSFVRFRRLDDLPRDVIGDAVGQMPVDRFVEIYGAVRSNARSRSRSD